MATEFYHNGTAKIRHKDSGVIYEIESDEVEWDVSSLGEGGMGPGNLYVGKLEHEELGSLEWSLSEYPIGAPETTHDDLGDHILVENFDYGLKHIPEDEEDPEDWDGLGHFEHYFHEITDEELLTLTREQQIEYLVKWFLNEYEDPVHDMPYNGREGGYQYIRGGPFYAVEELSDKFGKHIDHTIIDMAVSEIERDGTMEWVPKDDGTYYDDEPTLEELDSDVFAELESIIEQNIPLNFGIPEELKAREQIVEQLNELQASIEAEMAPIFHGGLGHNQPPPDPGIVAKYEELNPELQALLEEMDKDKPDSGILLTAGKFLKNWLLNGMHEANEKMFETIGQMAGAGVVATVTGAGAYIAVQVSDKAAGLYDSLINWIQLLI